MTGQSRCSETQYPWSEPEGGLQLGKGCVEEPGGAPLFGVLSVYIYIYIYIYIDFKSYI